MVITDVILPIVFIVLLGFLLRRFGGKYEHAFSKTQLYILGPALLFSVMARNDTGYGLILQLLIYVIILSAGLLLLTLDHLQNGRELARTFEGERREIVPMRKGKRVIEMT